MRYADGPTAQVEVAVDATADVVWALVRDIELPARFSAEFQGATWLDEPGPGARFRGRNRHEALGEWETISWVSRYDPPRAFGWCVTDPDHPSASWLFEIEPAGDGVRLRYTMRMGPAPSGLSIAIAAMPDKEERIVARRLQELEGGMTATVHGIQRLAEERR